LCFVIAIGGCDLFKPDKGEPPGYWPWPLGPIDHEPAWSPDGSTIIYYHAADYRDTTDTSGFYFINPNGTNKRLFLVGAVGSPDWSPDGQWIVFERGAQIYKIKVNGDNLTQLTFNGQNFFPDWSPDGKKIAYDSDIRVTNYSIWIMNKNGSNKHDIGIVYSRMPDWSPNGIKFVYAGGPGPTGAESQIWVTDTSGLVKKQLTYFGVTNRYPTWSPDGSKIAFTSCSENESGIWVTDSSGNNLHRLTDDVCIEPCCWSPDGKYIVYTKGLEGSVMIGDSAVYEPGDGRLWIMNADGTGKRQLTF